MNKNFPNIIWQTYKTKNLPIQAKECFLSWVNKNTEFKVELYDDDDIYNYLKDNFDDSVINFYNSFHIGVMKADLWRYCILKTHGGIYSDIDSLCIQPVKKWIKDQEHTFITEDILILGLENNLDYCQWTLVSTKNHPAMKYAIEYLVTNFKKHGIDKSNKNIVHATTGPSIFRIAINSFLGFDNKSSGYVFEKYTNDINIRNEIQKKGIYLLNKDAFENKYSRNLYGSQNFNDGYIRWIEEVKKLN